MNGLFDHHVTQPSPDFVALRDEPRNAQMRKLVEAMWKTFLPLADRNFPQEFAHSPRARFWEMYLGVRLLERGLQIIPKKCAQGPDFHLSLDGKDVWIEATVPEEGRGPDAVPSLYDHSRFGQVPEDKIKLRFANAISEKVADRARYIDRGVLGAADAYIIALNGEGIELTQTDGPLPAVVKSVYSVGDLVITVAWDDADVRSSKIVGQRYQIQPEVVKQSGEAVRTDTFLDRAFSGVSGILYSRAALWAMPETPGCDFLFIDNSVASSHVRYDWLGIGTYCYKEENHLRFVVQPPCT